MMKKIIFALIIFLITISCTKKENDSLNKLTVEQEILSLGRSVVWALNEANTDTLIRDFWQSDSTLFMIDGMKIQGYDNIRSSLKGIPNRRKNLVLEVDKEQVLVLSKDMAIHVVEFRQEVTHLNDSTSNDRGIWSTFYQKIDNNWKIIAVHESHLINEDN